MDNKKFIEGVDYYYDNGFIIMTEHYLAKRGYCCGNGCKNCAYDPKHQKGNINIKDDIKKDLDNLQV
jgi:hypothetical protein